MFRIARCALGRSVGAGRRRNASASGIFGLLGQRPRRLLQAAAIATAIVVVTVDLFTPADLLSFFYVVPIFIALLSGSVAFFWSLAIVLAFAGMVAYEAPAGIDLALRSLELNGVLCAAEVLLVAALMHVLRLQAERVDRTKRLLEAIVRRMPAGVVVADPTGAVMLANDCAGELWRDVAAPGGRLPQESPLARALAAGETTDAEEIPVFRADGSAAVLRVSAVPVRDAGGRTAAAVMTYGDVTDMKRAAEERQLLLARERAARAEAEAANQAKDEFLAAVSHDLRSPLSAIAIWTHFLRQELQDGPQVRAVAKIDANVKVLGRLIDDLLDVSRISAGKLRFDMGPVALPAVVESAIDGVRATAAAKRIEIRFDVDGAVPPVVADPGRVLQVVTNLVENAIKFTPDRGTVAVRLERAGDRARLTVRDTGRGIAQEFLPHVFERFSQAPGAPREGLGLGLAIVRYIVEHHAGTVRADSAGADRGATFTVEMPLAPVAAVVGAN